MKAILTTQTDLNVLLHEVLSRTEAGTIAMPETLLAMDTLQFLTQHLNCFFGIYNLQHDCYEYVSPGVQSHLGYAQEELVGEEGTPKILGCMLEEHALFYNNTFMATVWEHIDRLPALANEKEVRFSCSIKLKGKEGSYSWYLIDSVVLHTDADGAPIRTFTTCTNIQQIKKDERIQYCLQLKNKKGTIEKIFDGNATPYSKTDPLLSQREFEVLHLIGQGFTNSEIADKLFITLNTVQTHRKNILRKTSCKGTAELTQLALQRSSFGWTS